MRWFGYRNTMIWWISLLCSELLLGYSKGLTITVSPNNYDVAEDVTLWKIITTPTTADANGTVLAYTYSYTPLDGKLFLFSNNGSLYYKNNPGFDHETTPVYTVTLNVDDSTSRESAIFSVNITDVNEKPHIVNLPASASILEERSGVEDIFDLKCFDPEGSPTNFTVVNVNPPNLLAGFGLKNATSSVLQALHIAGFDHESTPSVDVEIKCTDDGNPGGGTPLDSDTKWLLVQVTDVNEPPRFPIAANGDQPHATIHVKENLPIGTDITDSIVHDFGDKMQAFDVDAGDTITYDLDGNKHHGFFEVRNVNGEARLYIREEIDYERKHLSPNVVFRVMVYDSTSTPGNYYELQVTIENENDNLPVCNPRQYSATISENTPVASEILTISCTDADGPMDRFEITGPDVAKQIFTVNASGLLTVRDLPDGERASEIKFKVNAVQGKPPTWSVVDVTITIRDLNDNTPEFDKDFYNFETVCDPKTLDPHASVVIGKVKATDRDASSPGPYYDWLDERPDSTLDIDRTNGRIRLARTLDATTECGIRMEPYYVVANDLGSKSEKATVRIDTFKADLYLVNFVVDLPLSTLLLDEKRTRFIAAVSKACQVQLSCVGRLYRMYETPDSATTSTTLTIYALKDNSTDDIANLDQQKFYVERQYLLDIFATNVLTGIRDFDEFPVKEVVKAVPDPTFIETAAGKLLTALACLAFVGLIIGLTIMAAKMLKNRNLAERKKLTTPRGGDYGYEPRYKK